MSTKTITYEQVLERIKGKTLEEYTPEDLFDYYIVYEDDNQLEDIKVQQALIKNDVAIDYLIHAIQILEDEQAIKDLYSSDFFKGNTYTAIQGKIKSIQTIQDTITPEYNRISVEFIESENQKKYLLKAPIIYEDADLEKYKNKVASSKDNIIAVLENKGNEQIFVGFIKVYDTKAKE